MSDDFDDDYVVNCDFLINGDDIDTEYADVTYDEVYKIFDDYGRDKIKSIRIKDYTVDESTPDTIHLFEGMINLESVSLILLNGGDDPFVFYDRAFEDSPKLRWLNVDGECQIPDTFLEKNTNLVKIHLEYCGITEIPTSVFQNKPRLKRLSLRHNKISHIPIIDAPNLIRASLDYNCIKSIDEHAFSLCPKLNILVLSQNMISSFSHQHIRNCNKIVELYLENNNLTSISDDWPESLKWIVINENFLSDEILLSIADDDRFFSESQKPSQKFEIFKGKSGTAVLFTSDNIYTTLFKIHR